MRARGHETLRKTQTISVSPRDSIQLVLQAIDRSALGFALVVDDANRLLGAITDGDLRRALLQGSIDGKLAQDLMNPTPKTIDWGTSQSDQQLFLSRNRVSFAPLVDANGVAMGVAVSTHLPGNNMEEVCVVVMAGGLGSRLGALTQQKPKPLIEIDGEPILQKIIKKFRNDGFNQFTISLNYKAEMIRDYFGDGQSLGVNIDYVQEKERLGTGGALSLIDHSRFDHYFVTNADILCSTNYREMLDFHLDQKSFATMAVREYDVQIPFGVVETDGFEIKSLKEKPSYKHFINAGYYVLDRAAIGHVPRDTFFDMPTLFNLLREKDIRTRIFPTSGDWIDIGRPEDLERARQKTES